MFTGRRVPLFYENQYGLPGIGKLFAPKERAKTIGKGYRLAQRI
jgi:hypothetical protein